MGLKGTYSKINTVLYYISRVKVTPTDSPEFKVSFEPQNWQDSAELPLYYILTQSPSANISLLSTSSFTQTVMSHFFRPLLLSGGVLKLSRNQDSMETEKEWEVLISTEGFNQDVWLLSIRLSDPMHFVLSACNHIAGIMQIQVYTETKHECCILLYCHEFNLIHDIFWCSLVIGPKNPLWLT